MEETLLLLLFIYLLNHFLCSRPVLLKVYALGQAEKFSGYKNLTIFITYATGNAIHLVDSNLTYDPFLSYGY